MTSRRPGTVRLIAAAGLVASCHPSCREVQPYRFAQELERPSLLAVAVTPGEASIAPGATQQFTATGVMSDGHLAAVNVTWSATGGVVTTGGVYTAGTAPGDFRVIAVEAGGALADTSAVTVVAGAPPSPGDLVVEVPAVPAGQPRWVLLDSDPAGAGGVGCPQDLVRAFTGPGIGLASIGTCTPEVAAFASGYAPELVPAPVPTMVAGNPTIKVTLNTNRTISLNVTGEYPGSDSEAQADVVLASDLSDANHLGIRFALAGPVRQVDPTPGGPGAPSPLAAAIGGGCAGVAANPTLRQPGRLNVIYVRDDQWSPEWAGLTYYGYNCWDKGFWDIIFIREGHVPATLMHEIGHALDLRHVLTGGLPGAWPTDNLMRTGIWSPGSTASANALSLGQVYRANFHDGSWLNAGGLRSGAQKHCTDTSVTASAITWPCPQLQLAWQ